jgi:hypothetical protein
LTSNSVIVGFNNNTKPATVEFSVPGTNFVDGTTLSDRLGNVKDVRVANGTIRFELPARSSVILVKQ